MVQMGRGNAYPATVLLVGGDTAVLSAAKKSRKKAGSVVNLDTGDGFRATANLTASECSSFCIPVLVLSEITWHGQCPRAPRVACSFRVTVDYVVGKELKRTVGETADLSASGVRVRVRAPMSLGTPAMLMIHINDAQAITGLSRVRRIAKAADHDDRGYDVAFAIERWVKGENLLSEIAGLTESPTEKSA